MSYLPTPRNGPSPFLEGTCIEFAWDSTAIGMLKRCPRLYQLAMIEGWKPKDSRFHLEFGIFFTNAMEHFDKVRAEGMGFEDAVYEAVHNTMDATWMVEDHWAEDHVAEGHPWETNDTAKNRYTLLRAIVGGEKLHDGVGLGA